MHRPYALLIGPNRETASSVAAVLQTGDIECAQADSGPRAWEVLAIRRPDVVFAELETPGLDVFHRRLRDEYMGVRPRIVALAIPGSLEPEVASLDLDAVLLKPIGPALLSTVVGNHGEVSLDPGRLRELCKVSVLGADFQSSLDALAHRLVLIYGMTNCYVLATASERQWVGAVGKAVPADQWPQLWDECDQAVNAGAPLLTGGPGAVETRFAAPIRVESGAIVGAICLHNHGPRLFSGEARDALNVLAHRLGTEISWRSVYDRVTAERDRLRENSMIDTMLGVLSRVALEQALSTEIARYHRKKEPLCVAVLDIAGLRQINDRYGHLAGDAALKHLADITRRHVRAQDIVARYGGDEIAVILPATATPGATTLLDRLRKAIESEPFSSGDGKFNLRVAIGVTEYGGKDDDVGGLLARAAATATTAKDRGGTIAIADVGEPGDETRPGVLLDRFEAGVTLGGMYQIAHEISRGAMGVVYRAEDLGLSRPVAIKMLRPDLVRDRDLVNRFRAEASVLAKLNHQNLVRVFAFMEEKDDVYFVMELVEGVSLDDVISESLEAESPLSTERVAAIVKQVAGALDAMHDAGLMHRDVKPGNVVLDRTRDRAVLVDVGLAKKMGTRSTPAGTPGFIAPETFRGGSETPASDVYGLAASTYALLTGRAPFGRSDDYKVLLQRQLDERPPLPSSYRTDVPMEADRVLIRGLAVDPRARYPTAGQFALALEEALSGWLGEVAPEIVGDPPPAIAAKLADLTARLPILKAAGNDSADLRRTLTLDLRMVPPAESREHEPLTRGVVFRSAARVLGLRTATSWVRSIARQNGELADALSLRTAPLSWIPAELFLAMLDAVSGSGRNADTFARELGNSVVTQTFRRFYPSSPESLSPRATFSALDILWRRYHTWGEVKVSRVEGRSAAIRFRFPRQPAVCAFAEGWLEAVVAMSGGQDPGVRHPQCEHRGGRMCEFNVRWGAVSRPSAALSPTA